MGGSYIISSPALGPPPSFHILPHAASSSFGLEPPTFSFPAIVNKQQDDEAIARGRATITPGGTQTSHQPGARGRRLAPHTHTHATVVVIINTPERREIFDKIP